MMKPPRTTAYDTRCLPSTPENIEEAAVLLRRGELVAFPTETVYGLGANALDPQAVLRIFAAKDRPADNPLIVHIADLAQVREIARSLPPMAEALMSAFWPGPLTLLMPVSPAIPSVVTAGLPTVGIRMPSHPVALALLRACGLPIAAPSANRSGRPSPTTAAHTLQDMAGRIPLVLDGGPCEVGLESTFLDITGPVPLILRPGGITPEQIAAVAGDVRIHETALAPLGEDESPLSPGMKYRHYAPKGQVLVVGGPEAVPRMLAHYDRAVAAGQSALLIAPLERKAQAAGRAFLPLGSLAQPQSWAQSLFSALRQADDLGAQHIFVEALPAQGIGLAVQNRLLRAAGFHMEE